MPFVLPFLTGKCFPASGVPFTKFLDSVFLTPAEINRDYSIHCPNVIRLTRALVENNLDAPGLIKTQNAIDDVKAIYSKHYREVMSALEAPLEINSAEPRERVRELLMVAALYHDVGKSIRKANHGQIGANLLRNYDEVQRKQLVDGLALKSDPPASNSKENRFSLIASIVQHHDKFGVVSTGEGGLPIFSDILYFSSNGSPEALAGIKKNVTSVMLMNLADIAAVCTAPKALLQEASQYAARIAKLRSCAPVSGVPPVVLPPHVARMTEQATYDAWMLLIERPECCLGLDAYKIANVLADWEILIDAIHHNQVQGSRVALKLFLLHAERNPARTIKRILRLLYTVTSVAGASALRDYISTTTVESVLVGTLGSHQFQRFSEQFANVAKLDYGLEFFRAIFCACVRMKLKAAMIETHPSWKKLTDDEVKLLDGLEDREKSILADQLTILFVRVLESLVGRYSGVLDHSSSHPRRFGFQMRDLTLDEKIRESVVRLLCVDEQKEPIALTWIADEVTIWSMD